MCLYPKLVLNPKYLPNKKNNGTPPSMTNQAVKYVPIGCGKCIECARQKARAWQIRLQEELKSNKEKAYFMAFTFSPDGYAKCYKAVKHKNLNAYETDNAIVKYAVRHFLEIWRKHNKKSVKHWLVSELGHGDTEHIHVHGIIWGDAQQIKKHWKYGMTWVGDKPNNWVNDQTINYIIKYVTKTDIKHSEYKPVILCSAGIGSNYTNTANSKLNKYNRDKTDETYKFKNARKANLPIYYRNKIYSEDHKETLWINKINKQERWILGQRIKINTKEGLDNYYKLLEDSQAKNKRLGYGDDKINWELKIYQNEMRLIKQYERGVITEDEMIRAKQEYQNYINKKK